MRQHFLYFRPLPHGHGAFGLIRVPMDSSARLIVIPVFFAISPTLASCLRSKFWTSFLVEGNPFARRTIFVDSRRPWTRLIWNDVLNYNL